jgi:hypothetical protein
MCFIETKLPFELSLIVQGLSFSTGYTGVQGPVDLRLDSLDLFWLLEFSHV